ncbi:hypothetical protein [Aeoliella sp.]|uniref:hypothetical protein n=1 Tax=Aeoliella sp. TaxID=2795800 RepID=UPI003CCC249A
MSRLCLFIVAAVFALGTARAEIFLSAEVMPTPGLAGFSTYTITATSNVGKITAYDFGTNPGATGLGVFGPLHQGPFDAVFDVPAISLAAADPLYAPVADTRFLISSNDVLAVRPQETSETLKAAFAFHGTARRETTASQSFLQIVTEDPTAVHLSGLIISQWNDQAADGVVDAIDISLTDIPIGPAPDLASLPVFTPPVKEVPLRIQPTPTVPVTPEPITPVPVKLPEGKDSPDPLDVTPEPNQSPNTVDLVEAITNENRPASTRSDYPLESGMLQPIWFYGGDSIETNPPLITTPLEIIPLPGATLRGGALPVELATSLVSFGDLSSLADADSFVTANMRSFQEQSVAVPEPGTGAVGLLAGCAIVIFARRRL